MRIRWVSQSRVYLAHDRGSPGESPGTHWCSCDIVRTVAQSKEGGWNALKDPTKARALSEVRTGQQRTLS